MAIPTVCTLQYLSTAIPSVCMLQYFSMAIPTVCALQYLSTAISRVKMSQYLSTAIPTVYALQYLSTAIPMVCTLQLSLNSTLYHSLLPLVNVCLISLHAVMLVEYSIGWYKLSTCRKYGGKTKYLNSNRWTKFGLHKRVRKNVSVLWNLSYYFSCVTYVTVCVQQRASNRISDASKIAYMDCNPVGLCATILVNGNPNGLRAAILVNGSPNVLRAITLIK